MAAKFISGAIDILFALIEAAPGLAAELTAVEVDEGLAVGALYGDTVTYKQALVPQLNRSPLIMVFSEGMVPIDTREKLWNVDAKIALNYKSGPDVEAGQKVIERYITALHNFIINNPRLGDTTGFICEALPGVVDTVFASIGQDDESQTKFIAVMDVDIVTDNSV